MEEITREFIVTDNYGDVTTLKISSDSITNLLGWLNKLNLASMGEKMTLWTFKWLADAFLESEGGSEVVGSTQILTEKFDDDFYNCVERGELFQVTLHIIDSEKEEWFWLNFMFGFNEEGGEEVKVFYESVYYQEATMKRLTGHNESYTLPCWKKGMSEIQTMLQKAFPEIPVP